MANEVTVIPNWRTRVTLSLVLEPLEIPSCVIGHDTAGGEHHIEPAALDFDTLEHLAASFRARLLNAAGYSVL